MLLAVVVLLCLNMALLFLLQFRLGQAFDMNVENQKRILAILTCNQKIISENQQVVLGILSDEQKIILEEIRKRA